MMKYEDFFNWNEIGNYISKFVEQEMEEREKELARLVSEYDFIVGSIECKRELIKVLPPKANIVYSPYVADRRTVYVIKKFDIADLISDANNLT